MNYITAVNGGNTPTWEMGWRDTPCLWYTYVGCRAPSEHPLFEGNTPSWEIWAGGTRQASGTYMWDAGLRASPVRREHTLMGDMGRRDTPCLWYVYAGCRAPSIPSLEGRHPRGRYGQAGHAMPLVRICGMPGSEHPLLWAIDPHGRYGQAGHAMPLVRICGMPGSEHPLSVGNRPSWEVWAGRTRHASGTRCWLPGSKHPFAGTSGVDHVIVCGRGIVAA